MSKKLGQLLVEGAAPRPSTVGCVEMDNRPVATVTICPWEEKEWTFPWVRLDAFSFSDREDSERLELFFPNHHIVADGENLREILGAIREFKVRRLRDLPASHRAMLPPEHVFVAQLQVKASTECGKSAAS
jgi:hypothetical protein